MTGPIEISILEQAREEGRKDARDAAQFRISNLYEASEEDVREAYEEGLRRGKLYGPSRLKWFALGWAISAVVGYFL